LTQSEIISLAIFCSTYGAIVFRNIIKMRIPIWLILLLGASGMIASGTITPSMAYASINMEVLTFLFGMFVIVSALDISGVLEFVASRMIKKAKSPLSVILLIFLVFGFLSAFLMNDTLALMGTPIVLSISRRTGMNAKLLLLSLAFAVTIGSSATPMGNPQNLLVALESDVRAPVISFLRYLSLPALFNLILTFFVVFMFARKEKIKGEIDNYSVQIKDRRLAFVSVGFAIFTLASIFAVNIAESFGGSSYLGISEVSLIGASLILAFGGRPREILNSVEWGIIVMFAALFIIMGSLSVNGVISSISHFLPSIDTVNKRDAILPIIISSLFLSQVLSNVPMVALYLPLMLASGFNQSDLVAWSALAGASTLAGNLTILGAASNLIIIERAEKEGFTVSFFEFLKVGIFVTAVNITILYLFLLLNL
jgi:Na+/H+ antiporter NhaD/arsenite permease-like protein